MATKTAELLTVAEVSAKLRVSLGTIYHLVAAGSLPALRIGGAIRIDAADLAEYLAENSRV